MVLSIKIHQNQGLCAEGREKIPPNTISWRGKNTARPQWGGRGKIPSEAIIWERKKAWWCCGRWQGNLAKVPPAQLCSYIGQKTPWCAGDTRSLVDPAGDAGLQHTIGRAGTPCNARARSVYRICYPLPFPPMEEVFYPWCSKTAVP